MPGFLKQFALTIVPVFLLGIGWISEATCAKRVAPFLHPPLLLNTSHAAQHNYNLRPRRGALLTPQTVLPNGTVNDAPIEIRGTDRGNLFIPAPPGVTQRISIHINDQTFTPESLPHGYKFLVLSDGHKGLWMQGIDASDNNSTVQFSWQTYDPNTQQHQVHNSRAARVSVYSAFVRPPPAEAESCISGLACDTPLQTEQIEQWSQNPGLPLLYKSWLGGEFYDHALYLDASTGTEPLNRYVQNNPYGHVIVIVDDSNGPVPMNESLVFQGRNHVNMVGWRLAEEAASSASGSGEDLDSAIHEALYKERNEQRQTNYSRAVIAIKPEIMQQNTAIQCTGGSQCTFENLHVSAPKESCVTVFNPSGGALNARNYFARYLIASGQVLNCQFDLPDNVIPFWGNGYYPFFKNNVISSNQFWLMVYTGGSCQTRGRCGDNQIPCLANSEGCPVIIKGDPNYAVRANCQGTPWPVSCIKPTAMSSAPYSEASSSPVSYPTISPTKAITAGATVSTALCQAYGAGCAPTVTPSAAPLVSTAVALGTAGVIAAGAGLFLAEEGIRYAYQRGPTIFDLLAGCMKWCNQYRHRSKPHVIPKYIEMPDMETKAFEESDE